MIIFWVVNKNVLLLLFFSWLKSSWNTAILLIKVIRLFLLKERNNIRTIENLYFIWKGGEGGGRGGGTTRVLGAKWPCSILEAKRLGAKAQDENGLGAKYFVTLTVADFIRSGEQMVIACMT